MNNNILNYAKKSLSVMLALALLAISLFTGVSINTKAADATTDTWDGSYSQPTATDTDGTTILISTAEELAWVILQSGSASAGVTYKVADGIDAFYMNENTADLTLEQVKNSLDGNNVNVWEYQSNIFQGTLDGNGVTIYGLYSSGASSGGSNDGGLIPYASGNVTVKNIAVKNSYIGGYKYASALITNTNDSLTSLTVQQCVVTNNYIFQTRSTQSSGGSNYAVGALGGYIDADADSCSVTVDNCLVYGNELYSTSSSNNSGTFAQLAASDAGLYKFTNLIISGAAPWSGNYSYYARLKTNFTNVYTDTDASEFTFNTYLTNQYPNGTPSDWCTFDTDYVQLLTTANMQGIAAKTNMPNLAWNTVWQVSDSGFPIATFISENSSSSNEESSNSKNIIYWNGESNAPDETKVDSDGNIFIYTAEELHYIANTASSGKSYKVADGIDVIILQPESTVDAETLMGLADYNAVKTYLTETVTATAWCDYSSDPPVFNGSFDGNGVEIYGLYGVGDDVGLFPGIDGGTDYKTEGHVGNTFQNFALRNSYLESNRRLGVIGAYSATGIGTGTVNVKNCEVSNCYITSTTTTEDYFGEEGLLIGRTKGKEIVHIENCLVYDNYSYATGLNKQIPLYSGAFTGDSNYLSTVENCLVLGAEPYPTASTSSKTHGVNCFENVYTDQAVSTYTTYADTDMKQIALDDIKGDAAKTVMPKLDWTNIWITVDGEYPALRLFYDASSDDGSTDEDSGGDNSGTTGGDTGDGDDVTVTVSDTWDGTLATSFESGTGTKADPFIIKTAEQLAFLASGANGTTGGKYYKVADGIEAFDMSGFEGITLGSTLTDVKAASKTGKNWSATYSSENAFCGVFDGNGATVYNLYGRSVAMGLFPCISGYDNATAENITIKNITVKNSYFEATGSTYTFGAGGIFGRHTNSGSGYPITVEKCVVESCYITNTNESTQSYAGAIGGTVRWSTAVISNCLVADNEIVGGTVSTGGLIAVAQGASAITATGCVVIGMTPYPSGTLDTDIEYTSFADLIDPTSYTKTYTDQTVDSTHTGITTLTTAQMTGEAAITNMTGLDWGNNWKVRENYYPVPFTPVVPEGAWNGEEAADYAGGDGSETNPFIIENAAQLYKMVKSGGEDANGNAAYFKVKDGVYDIYANPVEGKTAAEVKAYFADNTTYKAVWDPQTTEFNGNFDGNGVTIHGLYNVKDAASKGVAFLPQVSNSKAFINNVQFSDCYFENTASAYNFWTSAAVLVGRSDNSTINFNNVAVCDSTAICASSVAAVFVAANGATVTIDTAFTSGNTLYSEHYYSESLTYTYEGILYGDTQGYLYTIKNSVFTETDEYVSRVHYKVSIKFENSYVASMTASSMTGISVSEILQSSMLGNTAKTNMPDLDWTAWILTDSYPAISALHDLEYTDSGDSGHSASCNDCEISVSLEDHTYDSNYKCVLCGFEHSHTLVDNGIDYDATCVDSGVMNVKCEYCDYTSTREICAKTHSFGETIAATAGDCKTEATVAYKICLKCELCFTPEAEITSTEPLDHIGTGYTARHDWVEQDTLISECGGVDSITYYNCSVCNTYLVEGVMCDTVPTTIDGHIASNNYYISENTHANICVTCGEIFNEQAHTDEDTSSICDICGWPCGEHIFEGASITLTDSIAVNYMINKSVVSTLGYNGLYIEFTFRGKDYTVSTYTETDEYYVFTLDKIAPHLMTDVIYATLHGTKDGVSYTSETSEYSIKRYCHNILEKSTEQDTELRTLLVDLLNYGAESQIYTNYNTTKLANADLSDVQKAWGTTGDVETKSVQNLKYEEIDTPTVKWKAAGLYLDEEATLRFTIQADSVDNLAVKVTCGTTIIEIPSSEFVKRNDVNADNMYYVYVRGINVSQMRNELYLTVYDGETAASNTICYSVESYAHTMLNNVTSTEQLKNLLIAMIKYGDAAKAYLDAIGSIV